jgi:hypothetical protein
VYVPEVVSEVILHASQQPIRELFAGGSGAKLGAAKYAPRLADLYMERWTFDAQRTDKPVNGRPDNLYEPVADDGGERGRNWSRHTRGSSVYTKAFLHPRAALSAFAAVVAGVALASVARKRFSSTGLTRS